METLSALLALCAKGPATHIFDVFYVVSKNKILEPWVNLSVIWDATTLMWRNQFRWISKGRWQILSVFDQIFFKFKDRFSVDSEQETSKQKII